MNGQDRQYSILRGINGHSLVRFTLPGYKSFSRSLSPTRRFPTWDTSRAEDVNVGLMIRGVVSGELAVVEVPSDGWLFDPRGGLVWGFVMESNYIHEARIVKRDTDKKRKQRTLACIVCWDTCKALSCARICVRIASEAAIGNVQDVSNVVVENRRAVTVWALQLRGVCEPECGAIPCQFHVLAGSQPTFGSAVSSVQSMPGSELGAHFCFRRD
jgi:hypothetical protein